MEQKSEPKKQVVKKGKKAHLNDICKNPNISFSKKWETLLKDYALSTTYKE